MSTTSVQLPTGTYNVDPVHSVFGFAVKYNGIASFRSTFEKVDATYEDGVLTGSADVASIAVNLEQFKDHLLGADFFDAERFPTVTFRSTSIAVSEDGSAVVEGELTLRGVTTSVTATGTLGSGTDAFGHERLAFVLETTIDRRDYGITWQNPLPNGNDSLAYDVTVSVDLQLVKQG